MYSQGAQISLVFIYGTALCLLFVVAVVAFVFTYQNRIIKHQQQLRLKEEENQLNFLRAIIQGQENEQQRLAQELHDGLANEISAVNIFTNLLLPLVAHTPTGTQQVQNLLHMVHELHTNTRKIAHGLLPANINEQGLQTALYNYIQELNTGTGTPVQFNPLPHYQRLSHYTELHLYRIVQELIQNARKHAQAQTITVTLQQTNAQLHITVADNGSGFTPNLTGTGIGLKNLQARAKLINAQFTITPFENTGTIATLVI